MEKSNCPVSWMAILRVSPETWVEECVSSTLHMVLNRSVRGVQQRSLRSMICGRLHTISNSAAASPHCSFDRLYPNAKLRSVHDSQLHTPPPSASEHIPQIFTCLGKLGKPIDPVQPRKVNFPFTCPFAKIR